MQKTENRLSEIQLLVLLFTSFFKIALFIVGGGLVMVPVIEQIFVQEKKLLKKNDILDMLAIMQTMPGMMAVNAAIFVGHKLAGFKGAFVSVIGVILPSIIILMGIAALFQNLDIQNPHMLRAFSCVRACVVALFLGTAWRLAKNVFQEKFDYCAIGGFLMALLWGTSQVALILISVLIGWLYAFCNRCWRRQK